MSSLSDQYIADTFDGLLHTSGEPIPSSGKAFVYDGLGNKSSLSIGRNTNGVGVAGQLQLTNGNIDMTIGDININNGNLKVASGDINVNNGDLRVVGGITNVGTTTIQNGNLNLTTGDLDIASGDLTVTDMLKVTSRGVSIVSALSVTNNILMTTGDLKLNDGTITSSGNIRTTGGDIYTDNGNINVTSGDINVSSGNVTVVGKITSSGNITTNNGDINVNNGDLRVVGGITNVGTTTIQNGNLNLTTGDLDIAAGDLTVTDMLKVTSRGVSIVTSLSVTNNVLMTTGDLKLNDGKITSSGNITTTGGSFKAGDLIFPNSVGDTDDIVVQGSGNSLILKPQADLFSDIINFIYPVGHILMTLNGGLNPNTRYPSTTWVRVAEGRFLVGQGTGTDSDSSNKTFSTRNTAGVYNVTLTTNQIPAHTHTGVGVVATSFPGSHYDMSEPWSDFMLGKTVLYHENSGHGSFTITEEKSRTLDSMLIIDEAGEGQAHSNTPPGFGVYVWERTD